MRRRRNITDNLGCHGQKFAGRGEWRFSLQAASAGDKTITQLTQPDSGKNGSELEYTKLHPSFEMSSKLPKSGVWSVFVKFELIPLNHQLGLEWRSGYIREWKSFTMRRSIVPRASWWGKNHPFRGTIGNWKNTIRIFCALKQVWHWPLREASLQQKRSLFF